MGIEVGQGGLEILLLAVVAVWLAVQELSGPWGR